MPQGPSHRSRRASGPHPGTRTPPTPSFPNFDTLWSSRDLARLDEIPKNERGWCSCRICGQATVVKGSVFQQHMLEIHAPVPSPKRSRPTSLPVLPRPLPSSPLAVFGALESPQLIDLNTPLNTPPGSPSATQAAALGLRLSLMDIDVDDGNEGGAEYDGDGEESFGGDLEEPGAGLPIVEPVSTGLSTVEVEDAAAELQRLVEQGHLSPLASPTHHSLPPSPEPLDLRPSATELAATLRGTDVAPSNTSNGRDIISKWPYPLPRYLIPPPASGSQPNPFAAASSDDRSTERTVFDNALPLLAHTLTGFHNASRRSVELVLRITSSLVWHTKLDMFNKFKAFYLREHPPNPDILARMEEGLAPTLEDTPRTVRTALKRLDIDDSLIVHPVCRNHSCNHVFYGVIDQQDFHSLPILCPTCDFPIRGSNGLINVLHYPRRTLQAELEVILRVPGVEEAIERRKSRKVAWDARDAAGALPDVKIYRQQDDGSAWESRASVDDGVLHMTVNLGFDSANPNHHRSAAASSMSPITLMVADLPPQLRASFSCAMLMGVTPAPKAPSAENLWKFLLPLCLELRDSETHGVWVRSPKFPQGRLVKVFVGCVCCDRPAAVQIAGGPYYKRHDAPCLRCLIHLNQITSLAAHPARPSFDHTLGVIAQMSSVPLALQADKEAYHAEPAIDANGVKKKRTYTNERRDACIDLHTPYKGYLSSLNLIVDLDVFQSTVFDPMHSLLEGCCKTYFFKVMQAGAHQYIAPDGQDIQSGGDVTAGDQTGGSTDGGSESEGDGGWKDAEAILAELAKGSVNPRPPAVINALQDRVKTLMAQGRGKGKGKAKEKSKKRQKKLRMSEADIAELQRLIPTVTVPSFVQRLHPLFGTPAAGTPSANDWRTFSTVFAPLVLPVLFAQRHDRNEALSPEELEAQMLLCEFVHLAIRSSISELQILRLEERIASWQELVFRLHPSLVSVTNLHVISHLGEDIRKFGPLYGWWSFLIERINHIVKSTNRSGASAHQAQVVAMRATIRSRDVVSARARALGLQSDGTSGLEEEAGVDQQLASELSALFDPSSADSATSLLEQIGSTYAEIDRQLLHGAARFSASIIEPQCKGRSRQTTLGPYLLGKLQACLLTYGQRTSLSARDEHPYLSSAITEWEGMVFSERRLDAAEWTAFLGPTTSSQQAADLATKRNSLFEARSPSVRYRCQDARVRGGIISRIFQHSILVDGVRSTGLYAVIRRFKGYDADPYGYRAYPSLDIWCWEADELEDASIVSLKSNTLDSLRPLALARLPKNPGNVDDESIIWTTLPIHHH